jgi:hypothetical protein
MQRQWISVLAGGALLFTVTGSAFAQGESGGAASGGAASGGATSVAPAPEAAAPPPAPLEAGPVAPVPVAVAAIDPLWIVGGAVLTGAVICAIVCGGSSSTSTTH